MRLFSVTLAALALAACHQEVAKAPAQPVAPAAAPPVAPVTAPTPPPHVQAPPPSSLQPAPDVDALWAFAPEDATMGIVVSPRALAMTEHAWQDIQQFMAGVPEMLPALGMMKAEIRQLGMSTLSFAAAGLSADRGLASFGITARSTVLILPVVDRDKFLAVAHGTKGADFDKIGDLRCKQVRGRYACAEEVSRLDTLGSGNLQGRLARAQARGDIEVAGKIENVSFAVVAQLARGSVVVRGIVDGVPAEMHEAFGHRALAVPGDADGFAWIAIQPLMPKLVAEAEHAPIIAGITWADLVRAVSGVVELVAPGGANEVDVHLPLQDARPVEQIVQRCARLPIHGTLAGGKCQLASIKVASLAPEFWVEQDELRARVALPFAHGGATPMSAIGAELAQGDWALAFWGRGTDLATTIDFTKLIGSAKLADPDSHMAMTMGMRSFAMLNEIGGGLAFEGDSARFVFALRTAWANPDDVVAKLTAIGSKAIVTGRARLAAKAIADAAPTSPFADDFRAGASGLVVASTPIAALAVVGVKVFVDSLTRAAAIH